jgi:hypothetical protein
VPEHQENEMDDLSYAQLSCLMLGKELQASAKLADMECGKNISAIARKMRDVLITLGLRKRKTGGGRKKAEAVTEPAKRTPKKK